MAVRALLRVALGALLLLVLALLEPVQREPMRAESVVTARAVLFKVVGGEKPVAGAELAFFSKQAEQYVEVLKGADFSDGNVRGQKRRGPSPAMSDAGGQMRVRLATGEGWLIVRKEGFARWAQPLRIVKGEGQLQVEINLVPSARLGVEVRAEGQNGEVAGLAGATVLVGEWGQLPWALQTAADGRASFVDLPPGPWRVQIYAPGYEPFIAETEADLLVQLRPVMALRVRVTRNGKPEPGAEVHVSGSSLWPSRAVETGREGFVDIQGLGAGTYSLYAERADGISAASAVELLAERGVREVSLSLETGQFVDVAVTSDLGTYIAKARLTWSTDGLDQMARRAITDESGRARLGPLLRRDGWVQAAATGFVERVVPVGAEGLLQIVLDRAGTVVGRVVDDKGYPVEGAAVEVVGTDVHGMPIYVRPEVRGVQEAHFEWARTNQQRLVPAGELGVMLGPVPPIPLNPRLGPSSGTFGSLSAAPGQVGSAPVSGGTHFSAARGRFRIENVPPGQIVVLARHPQFIDGKSKSVTLVAGGQVETEVVLRNGEPLRGRVVDDRGFPVSDAHVSLLARGFSRQLSVESDGTFQLAAAPKDLSLRVSRTGRPLRVLLERTLADRKPTEEIELALPALRPDSVVVVLDEKGEAVPLAQVRVISKDPRAPLEETRFTGERGEVEFTDVRGLPVVVDAKAPGFVEQKRSLHLGAKNEIRLVRALTVIGRVTTARGRLPASYADVILEGAGMSRRSRANESGEYKLIGIAPGAALLRASAAAHGRGQLAVMVQAGIGGRETELPDLDLTPTVELFGRVVDERGFPVANAWVSVEPLSVYLPAAVAPADAARTDANGEFKVDGSAGRALKLFAVAPARAGGTLDLPPSDRDRLVDLVIRLDRVDLAPAEELGTVLIWLSDSKGQLEVAAVAQAPYGDASELEPGDVLIAVEGEKPADLHDARSLLSGVPGSSVRLTVERRGHPIQVRVTREAFMR